MYYLPNQTKILKKKNHQNLSVGSPLSTGYILRGYHRALSLTYTLLRHPSLLSALATSEV